MSVIYVYAKIWSRYLYSFQSYKRGPKISKFGHVTQATPTFVVRTQYGSVLNICAKFEGGISILSKIIRDPKISKFGHVTQATPT